MIWSRSEDGWTIKVTKQTEAVGFLQLICSWWLTKKTTWGRVCTVCVCSAAAHSRWSCFYSQHLQDLKRDLCLWLPNPKLSYMPYHDLPAFNPLLNEENQAHLFFSTSTSILREPWYWYCLHVLVQYLHKWMASRCYLFTWSFLIFVPSVCLKSYSRD